MQTEIIRLNSITDCNRYFSSATLHPLVSVIDVSDPKGHAVLQLQSYAVLFKERSCHDCFGWKDYDFSDGRLVFVAPGQSINIGNWTGRHNGKCLLLCFNPSLTHGTLCGIHFDDYSFFHYRQDEALHLSCRERTIVEAGLESISEELRWGVDEYSRRLLVNRIELLLNCCSRFYKRQFITRHDANQEILDKANRLLENYFLTGQVRYHGLPDTGYFSRMLGLSSAYFGDLLKHETGKSIYEFVSLKRIDIARGQLLRTGKSVSCIAEELGFPSVQYFSRLFKRLVGHAPNECRMLK